MLVEKPTLIKDLRAGQEGYVPPWAFYEGVNRLLHVRPQFDVFPDRTLHRCVRLRHTGHGLHADFTEVGRVRGVHRGVMEAGLDWFGCVPVASITGEIPYRDDTANPGTVAADPIAAT